MNKRKLVPILILLCAVFSSPLYAVTAAEVGAKVEGGVFVEFVAKDVASTNGGYTVQTTAAWHYPDTSDGANWVNGNCYDTRDAKPAPIFRADLSGLKAGKPYEMYLVALSENSNNFGFIWGLTSSAEFTRNPIKPADGINVVGGQGNKGSYLFLLDNAGQLVADAEGKLSLFFGPIPPATADYPRAELDGLVIVEKDPTFNPAPKVAALPNGLTQIYLGDTLQLTGTVTDKDPIEGDPGVLSWDWAKASGPGAVTFDPSVTADANALTATFDTKGTYNIVLQATDGTKDANDIVTVLVLDHADDKLMAHWEFEAEGTGEYPVLDSVSSNHGKFEGKDPNFVPSYATGWIGSQAVSFPGKSHVLIGIDPNSVPSFEDPVNSITVSAWIKVGKFDQDWQGAVTRGDNSWRLARNGSSNGMAFHCSGVASPSGSINVNDGLWHHVVGTYNGANVSLYVDGVLDKKDAGTGFINKSTYPVWIGGNSQVQREWNGSIDDVRVYNYGFSETQVRDLTAKGLLKAKIDAGANINFKWKPGMKTQLAGVVTDFGAPSERSIVWSTTSNGAQAQFDDASNLTTMVGFPEAGLYQLKLTVVDDGVTIEDPVSILVIAPTCKEVIADKLGFLTDLSEDCKVGLADLAIMLESWLKCNDPADPKCEWPWTESL